MDPVYTSGTGTPVPGALTPREVFYMVRGLCSENNVVGFALRKLGLGNRDYLSPLTRGDGRR